jgi:hypothetical protein
MDESVRPRRRVWVRHGHVNGELATGSNGSKGGIRVYIFRGIADWPGTARFEYNPTMIYRDMDCRVSLRVGLLLSVTLLLLDVSAQLLSRVSGDGTDDGVYQMINASQFRRGLNVMAMTVPTHPSFRQLGQRYPRRTPWPGQP